MTMLMALINVYIYTWHIYMQRRVIETKSVEFMPFYLSFFSFLTSSLWMAYGLLSHDLVLAVRKFSRDFMI